MTKHQNHAFLAERLEGRRLLSATGESLAIGNVLYSSQAVSGGGVDLYRSNPDGSGRALLGHWVNSIAPPSNFFAYGDKLLFSANYQNTNYSGAELWSSDGTAAGTNMVIDLYESANGSNPRELHLINGRVVFEANRNSPYNTQLFGTDGTAAGTYQISPQTNGYSAAVQNVSFRSTEVAWDQSNDYISQLQRLSSDGSRAFHVAYTEPAGGVLRVSGYANTAMSLSVSRTTDGFYRVDDNGQTLDYRVGDVKSMDLGDSFMDDVITVDPSITVPVTFRSVGGNDTISGGGGVNTLDTAGHYKSYVDGSGMTQGVAAVDLTLRSDGGSAEYINGDRVELHGTFAHVLGTNGNDTIIGSVGAETLEGNGGDDSIVGNGGGDRIDGGDGGDTITASQSQDTIVADASDTIFNTDAEQTQGGGHASDERARYTLRAGILRVYGTEHADSLKLVGSASSIKLMLGAETSKVLAASVSTIIVYGGDGDDTISLKDITAKSKLYGDDGNDAITGSSGKDRIYGGDGDDSLAGGDNHDTIYGQAGDDRVFGGASSDYVSGGTGTDVIRGEGGFDHILYTATDDVRGNRGDRMDIDSLVG